MRMRRPLSIQLFVVSVHGNAPVFLLLKRRDRSDIGLPGFWQGVSGALEEGEDFRAAAIREAYEETGVIVEEVADTGLVMTYPIGPEWRKYYATEADRIEERVFYATIPSNIDPKLSTEHEAWRWCGFAEAKEMLTFGENAECLIAVNHLLKTA
jgi:dihydroneopterin triphosphate diphosphatase